MFSERWLSASSGRCKLITKVHPSIERMVSKIFVRGFCVSVFCVITIVVLEYFKVLDDSLAMALAVGFALSVGVAVLVPLYLMHRIRCPDCNKHLKTHKNHEIQRWVAVCGECEIEWNLNMGYSEVD